MKGNDLMHAARHFVEAAFWFCAGVGSRDLWDVVKEHIGARRKA